MHKGVDFMVFPPELNKRGAVPVEPLVNGKYNDSGSPVQRALLPPHKMPPLGHLLRQHSVQRAQPLMQQKMPVQN